MIRDELAGCAGTMCTGRPRAWMDIDRLIAEAYDGQTKEDTFRRFFLNQPSVRYERLAVTRRVGATARTPNTKRRKGPRSCWRSTVRIGSTRRPWWPPRLSRGRTCGLSACGNARNVLRPTGRSTGTPLTQPLGRRWSTDAVAELAFDPPGWHSEAQRLGRHLRRRRCGRLPTSSRNRQDGPGLLTVLLGGDEPRSSARTATRGSQDTWLTLF